MRSEAHEFKRERQSRKEDEYSEKKRLLRSAKKELKSTSPLSAVLFRATQQESSNLSISNTVDLLRTLFSIVVDSVPPVCAPLKSSHITFHLLRGKKADFHINQQGRQIGNSHPNRKNRQRLDQRQGTMFQFFHFQKKPLQLWKLSLNKSLLLLDLLTQAVGLISFLTPL